VDPIILGILGIILMVVLVVVGLPLPITFFLMGFMGVVLLKGWSQALGLLERVPYTELSDFSFSVIPLFIVLGIVLFQCGVGEEIFRALQRWLGQFPGGLAAAVCGACALLGTITGSAAASTILMAKVAYPEMKKVNYDPVFSLAVCAASGTVAMLIPPSTALVIYAIITEQSVAQLLLAGFIPGFLSMAIYAAMILIRVRFDPALGPPSSATPWRDRFVDLRYLLPAVIMMATIIGGLYFGVFTATEAGGIAALVSFIIVLALRRLTWARFKATIYETLQLTILVALMLMMIRGFYNLFLNITWLPAAIADMALEMPSPWLVLTAMYLICFIFGMLTGGPMGYVIVPLFTPVVESLGFNPVWFIITIVKMMETGAITPPVAFSAFIVQGIVREVPLGKLFKAVWWFVLCDMFTLGLFIAFPKIVMFLPDTMRAMG